MTTPLSEDLFSPIYADIRNREYAKAFAGKIAFETLGRLEAVSSLAVEAIAGPVDGIYGTICGAINLITLGTNDNIYKKARHGLTAFGATISIMHFQLLLAINPRVTAPISFEICNESTLARKLLTGPIKVYAFNCAISESIFKRHVVARLAYTASLIFTIIGRIIDFAIGVIASIFSLISLGTWRKCNEVAFTGLKILSLVDDIFVHLMKIINPCAQIINVGTSEKPKPGESFDF